MSPNFEQMAPLLKHNWTILQHGYTKMCKRIFGAYWHNPGRMRAHLFLNLPWCGHKLWDKVKMTPGWSQIDIRFAPNSPNINENDNKLFRKCPQTSKKWHHCWNTTGRYCSTGTPKCVRKSPGAFWHNPGTFVFEFAVMRAQTIGQSRNDPRLIPDWY